MNVRFLFITFSLVMACACEFKRTLTTTIPPSTISGVGSNQDPYSGNNNNRDDNTDPVLQEQSLEDLLDKFYSKFVKEADGRLYDTFVEYRSLYEMKAKEDPQFLELEQAILQRLEDPRAFNGLDNNEKIAFMLNAYNFMAIRVVYLNLKHEGKFISSITDVDSTVFDRKKIMKKKQFNILGKRNLSFEDIESKIPESVLQLSQKKDARVLFALIPATKSAGILLNQAYRGGKLDEQLDFITRSALRLPRFLTFDRDKTQFYIHSYFKNHLDIIDQDIHSAGVKNFIQTYRGLNIQGTFLYLEYDWNLNGNASENTTINLGDITVTPTTENPCDQYQQNNKYQIVAICDSVLNGQSAEKFKYNVERAVLCVMEQKNPATTRIVGHLEEENEDSREFRPFLDLEIKNSDIKTEGKKVSETQTHTISTFTLKRREITNGTIDIRVNNNEVVSYQLKLSQRLRFWSADMFKKKSLRSFRLNCHL